MGCYCEGIAYASTEMWRWKYFLAFYVFSFVFCPLPMCILRLSVGFHQSVYSERTKGTSQALINNSNPP